MQGPSSAARSWLCVFTSTPQSHFVRQLPVKGSLLVRFASLYDGPALKGDSSRARPVGDAARGESGGIGSIASGSAARRPYSNQRCGFRVAKAGGVIKRLIALCLSQPLSLTSFDSSPAGAPLGCSTSTACSAVPLRGAIVSMGLRGVQGGLRGEIEIFPGPPAKMVIKKLPSLLFISTPQTIRLTRVSALIFRIRRFQR